LFNFDGAYAHKSREAHQGMKGFPIIPRMPPYSNKVFNLGFFFSIQWKNGSIIDKINTITPNILSQVNAPLFIEIILMISPIT